MAKAYSTPTEIDDLNDLDHRLTQIIEIGECTQLVLSLETQVSPDDIYTFIALLRLLSENMQGRLERCYARFIHGER